MVPVVVILGEKIADKSNARGDGVILAPSSRQRPSRWESQSSSSLKQALTPHPQSGQRGTGPTAQVSSHFTSQDPNQGSNVAHSGWIFSPQLIIKITHPQEGPEAYLQMKLESVNWQSTLIILNGLLDPSFSKGSAYMTHH